MRRAPEAWASRIASSSHASRCAGVALSMVSSCARSTSVQVPTHFCATAPAVSGERLHADVEYPFQLEELAPAHGTAVFADTTQSTSDNRIRGQIPTRRSEPSPAPRTAGTAFRCSPSIRAFAQPPTFEGPGSHATRSPSDFGRQEAIQQAGPVIGPNEEREVHAGARIDGVQAARLRRIQ